MDRSDLARAVLDGPLFADVDRAAGQAGRGSEVIDAIRRKFQLSVPAVVLSDQPSIPIPVRAGQVVRVLSKPLDPGKLRDAVRELAPRTLSLGDPMIG